ncbi:MAG: hypothetical protein IJ885_02085 [Prevotella sp.]|nr:hypothetical protein [Prevotella sp.]
MKHIINYLGALLAVVLIGATFTACSDEDAQSANVGLGIKTFFPTKVVTNQPMTINGSGFNGVTEIEFPGGKKVTDFEIVGNDMIRVNAPSGIAADGGKIIVRTADDEAESHMSLTIGHTYVTGYSKQPGETATGGELIDVFGSDLEFINSVELLDADGVPQLIDHKDFYRKGTYKLTIRLPKKNIYKGTFVGILHTYDGQSIMMPELAYEPGADEGHWETVKTTIWKNEDPDGNGVVNWNGTYRFGLDGHDGNNECIATFPEDVWNTLKTGTFYILYSAPDPTQYQIRVTNGWWDTQWLGKDNDIAPWNMAERIIDNGDGTFYIEVNFGDDPLVGTLDEKHLLLTGSGYTPLEIYTEEDIWIDGPGGDQEVKTVIWTGDGTTAVNWNGVYRFGLDGHDGNNECIATFPEDIWNRLKTETFYVKYTVADPTQYQIRVTNGWWDTQWMGKDNDIAPWNMAERIIDNGDGTFYIEVNLGDDPLVGTLDEKHLLLTGSGYTPLEIYFIDIIHGGGGGSENVFWENSGAGAVSWNGTYRFGLDGHDGNNECITTFPQDIWDKIKTGTFYLQFKPEAESYQVRITNGWWDTQWLGKDNDFAPWNMADRIIDNGDGTYYIEINFGDDPLVETLDEKHLLFTGDGYTPLKLYFK